MKHTYQILYPNSFHYKELLKNIIFWFLLLHRNSCAIILVFFLHVDLLCLNESFIKLDRRQRLITLSEIYSQKILCKTLCQVLERHVFILWSFLRNAEKRDYTQKKKIDNTYEHIYSNRMSLSYCSLVSYKWRNLSRIE